MPKYLKENFSGGINQFFDETKVDLVSQQYIVINGRLRRGVIEPVKLPLDITSTLSGLGTKMQGFYAIGNFLLVFIDGNAYYTLQSLISWQKIVDFSMSADVDVIYAEPIPASRVNYKRTLLTTGKPKSGVILTDEIISSSPRAVIVMDGVSQPWVIFPDASARVCNTYEQWSVDDPEYVPIAKYPMYHPDGVLYCVGKDQLGNFTQIYRSVTGQPMNFVIPVKDDGSKTSDVETEGGAPAMADHVDYNEVRCLRLIDVPDKGFLVTTDKSAYLSFPDISDPIYAEPQFAHQFLFSVGSLNQFSVADIGGDTALIHYRGLRSFNGTSQVRFQGKNDPFSLLITDLLEGITQTTTAATTYDNFAVFSLTTKYGPAIIWYDTLAKCYSSVDIYPNIGLIKQFAVVQTSTALELYFYTADNKLYKAFASDEYSTCAIYHGALVPTAGNEHKIQNVVLTFSSCTKAGSVQCHVYHDRVRSETQHQALEVTSTSSALYEQVPFNPQQEDDTTTILFDFSDKTEYAHKCGVFVEFNAHAKLTRILVDTDEKTEANDPRSPQIFVPSNPDILIFLGQDSSSGAERVAVRQQVLSEEYDLIVGCGNHIYNDPEADMFGWWRYLLNEGKFIAVPGETDQDMNDCKDFREFMRMAPSRYFVHDAQNVSLMMFNDGFNSSGTQLEPDNTDGSSIETSTQALWLKQQLVNSIRPHKIVVWHQSPYTRVSAAVKTDMQAFPLRTWGASALVSAGAKTLERLYKDGFSYFNSGGGGFGLDTLGATTTESYFAASTYGYLVCKAWPLTLEFGFKNSSGSVLDQWIVRK